MATIAAPKGINNNILNMKSPNARRKHKPKATAAPVTTGQRKAGEPPSEAELIGMRINQLTDESLESTRRMLQLCDEVSSFSLHFFFAFFLFS